MPVFQNLIIRNRRKIGGIAIDGTIQELSTKRMKVTEYPVESGEYVTDHVIKEPATYQIEGLITDTPLGWDGVVESVTGVVDGITGLFGGSGKAPTRSKQIYNALVDLMNARQVIEIDTGSERYENLIFESISTTSNKDNSGGVEFTATFKEVLFVSTKATGLNRENIEDDVFKARYADIENEGVSPVRDANAVEVKEIGNSL